MKVKELLSNIEVLMNFNKINLKETKRIITLIYDSMSDKEKEKYKFIVNKFISMDTYQVEIKEFLDIKIQISRMNSEVKTTKREKELVNNIKVHNELKKKGVIE